MSSSDITKRAIASSFRHILETTPFERVTVSAIAADCGINRQTFYYHFHDIYGLMDWMIDDEILREVASCGDDWRKALVSVLVALRTDRIAIMTSMRTADPLITYHLLRDRLTELVLMAMGEEGNSRETNNDNMRFAADFCAGGLAEVIITWLEGGCVTEPGVFVSLVERTILYDLPNALSRRT